MLSQYPPLSGLPAEDRRQFQAWLERNNRPSPPPLDPERPEDSGTFFPDDYAAFKSVWRVDPLTCPWCGGTKAVKNRFCSKECRRIAETRHTRRCPRSGCQVPTDGDYCCLTCWTDDQQTKLARPLRNTDRERMYKLQKEHGLTYRPYCYEVTVQKERRYHTLSTKDGIALLGETDTELRFAVDQERLIQLYNHIRRFVPECTVTKLPVDPLAGEECERNC